MSNVNKRFVLELINQSDEPCVSIYISTEAARKGNFQKLEIKLKNKLAEAEKTLIEDWGFKDTEAKEFLNKARKLIDDISFWHHHEKGLALFISENKFDYVRINLNINDQVRVSKYIYIT